MAVIVRGRTTTQEERDLRVDDSGRLMVASEFGTLIAVQGNAPDGNPTGGNPVPVGLVDASGAINTWRNNTQGTLLASQARTAQTTSPDQTNYNARGVIVCVSVTAASGTGGITPRFQVYDPVTLTLNELNTAPAAITATGRYWYIVYPGAATTGVNTSVFVQTVAAPLPRSWRLLVTVGDASSYTYSASYAYIL